jgi:hypothetical protein
MPHSEQPSPGVSPAETAILQTTSAAGQAHETSAPPYIPRAGQADSPTTARPAPGEGGPLEPDPWLADSEGELPGRPRRRLLAPVPVALLSILLLACGFIGGVLVEKNQTSNGGGSALSSSGGLPASSGSAASRFRALLGGTRAGAPGTAGVGGALAGAGVTAGEVAYVRHGTLYVRNSEGNTLKVKAAPGSTVTKTVTTKVDSIHPGETVVVRGSQGSNGAIQASSITVGSSGRGVFGSLFAGRGGAGAATATGGTATGGTNTPQGAGEQPLFGP